MSGGNALKDVTRINQLNVEATIRDINERLLKKLSSAHFAILGSAGKKDPDKNGEAEGSSGDIDIAVQNVERHDIENICKELNLTIRYLPGLDICSIRWPICNTDTLQENKFVQLDIMLVDDVEFCKWSYYSPSFSESKYKGLYRNECIFACARFAEYEVLAVRDGQPIKWSRYFYNLDSGLHKGIQTNIGKKGNIIKSVTTEEKTFITNDPQKIVDLCFGEQFDANKLMTFEACYEAIMSEKFKLKEFRDNIIDTIKKNIIKKDVPLPKELEDGASSE